MAAKTEEQILRAAEKKTARAYQESPTGANLRDWTSAKNALAQYLSAQGDAAGAERFKNIEQAAAWVAAEGYLVNPRTVRNHADKPGFPKKQKDGGYLKAEIETYAKATWENPGRGEEEKGGNYAEAVKRETARKLTLENDIKEGKYLLKSAEEQRDARLLFGLKLAVDNFGPFVVQDLIALAAAQLPEEESAKVSRIAPELLARYKNQAAELFDRMAREGSVEVPEE